MIKIQCIQHECTHAHTHTCACTHTHTHVQARTHTHTHTGMHARALTHTTRTHIHIHATETTMTQLSTTAGFVRLFPPQNSQTFRPVSQAKLTYTHSLSMMQTLTDQVTCWKLIKIVWIFSSFSLFHVRECVCVCVHACIHACVWFWLCFVKKKKKNCFQFVIVLLFPVY